MRRFYRCPTETGVIASRLHAGGPDPLLRARALPRGRRGHPAGPVAQRARTRCCAGTARRRAPAGRATTRPSRAELHDRHVRQLPVEGRRGGGDVPQGPARGRPARPVSRRRGSETCPVTGSSYRSSGPPTSTSSTSTSTMRQRARPSRRAWTWTPTRSRCCCRSRSNGTYRSPSCRSTRGEPADASYDGEVRVFHDPLQRMPAGTRPLPQIETVAPANFHVSDIRQYSRTRPAGATRRRGPSPATPVTRTRRCSSARPSAFASTTTSATSAQGR